MIDSLIRWSLHHRAAIIALALVLTAIGVYTARRMPVDVFPDLTAPTVTVIIEAYGMAPTEVESQVTFPIEAALNGASGVRRVRSSTAVGISVVWVEFAWGMDIYAARQIVSEKVALIAGDLPPEVSRPVLAPISSIMGEILFLALTSARHSPIELRTTADTVMRRRLLAVPGVSQVIPIGGGEKQYQVLLSPTKLHTYGITLKQVRQALAASNQNVSAGFMVVSGAEYLVTGLGRVRTPEDIGAVAVAAEDGVPIRVADLGRVQVDAAPKRGEGSVNMQPAVILGVQKQPGTNTLTLTRTLEAVLHDLQAKLPAGMQITPVLRQADFIETAVENVFHALRDGGLLVIAIVLLFLANLRAACITLTAIPLSLLAAVLVLKAFGATINTMTLGGMAIAIGALVDDAVIDVENVFRRLRDNATLPADQRQSALQVVYAASVEIRASIVFATLIILLVFLPLFFLAGVEGRLLQPLRAAYVISLLASLAVAVTLHPGALSTAAPGQPRGRPGARTVSRPPPESELCPRAASRPALALAGHPPGARVPRGGALRGQLPGPRLPTRLQRRRPDDQCGHPARHVAGRIRYARPPRGTDLARASRGGLRGPADWTRRTRRARARGGGGRARRGTGQARPQQNRFPGGPPARFLTHSWDEHHHWPTDFRRIDHMLSGTRANIAVKIFGDGLSTLRTLGDKVRRPWPRSRAWWT